MSQPLFLAAADVSGSIPETFGLDLSAIGLQILWFVIFAGILWKFLLQPLSRTMDDRQKVLAEGLPYAEEMKHKLAEA